MEAVGAAASVIAVVELVAKVSASAACLMRDVRNARGDMIQVRKDMSDLSTVLSMVAEDLEHDKPHSQENIVCIAKSCHEVLLEIDAVLGDSGSRIRWAASGKEKVERLRARLETFKLSLDVALDYRTMVVVHDIKEDSTRIVGDISAIQRDITLLLGKVDHIDQKAWIDQELSDEPAPGRGMLDRFLNECRSETQTVLDSIEWEQDHDFEDAQALTPSSPPRTIMLKNSLGHLQEISLDICKTWLRFEEIIKDSYPTDSHDRKEIDEGRFTMYSKGEIIMPESWDDVICPGLCIVLKLWTSDFVPVFDALGRRYKFPWNTVRTWNGMREALNMAFYRVDVTGHHVEAGHYDLVGPDNTILLPSLWEYVIRPGMLIKMQMWPTEDFPPPGVIPVMSEDAREAVLKALERRRGAGLLPPPFPRASVAGHSPQTNRSQAFIHRGKQVMVGEPSEPPPIPRSFVAGHNPQTNRPQACSHRGKHVTVGEPSEPPPISRSLAEWLGSQTTRSQARNGRGRRMIAEEPSELPNGRPLGRP